MTDSNDDLQTLRSAHRLLAERFVRQQLYVLLGLVALGMFMPLVLINENSERPEDGFVHGLYPMAVYLVDEHLVGSEQSTVAVLAALAAIGCVILLLALMVTALAGVVALLRSDHTVGLRTLEICIGGLLIGSLLLLVGVITLSDGVHHFRPYIGLLSPFMAAAWAWQLRRNRLILEA
ncbi:MAG: hypothetical protein ACTH2Q_12105 [Propionibacteriaceae bacterium]